MDVEDSINQKRQSLHAEMDGVSNYEKFHACQKKNTVTNSLVSVGSSPDRGYRVNSNALGIAALLCQYSDVITR